MQNEITIPDYIIEKYRYINTEYNDFHDFLVEQYNEDMSEIGTFSDSAFDIYYRTCEFIGYMPNLQGLINRNKAMMIQAVFPDTSIITDINDFIYFYDNQFIENCFCDSSVEYENKIMKLTDIINDIWRQEKEFYERKFLKDIEEEFYYLISDEAVRDTIIANDIYNPE